MSLALESALAAHPQFPRLFSPLELGITRLKNRIAAMELREHGSSRDETVALARAIENAAATIMSTLFGWHPARNSRALTTGRAVSLNRATVKYRSSGGAGQSCNALKAVDRVPRERR
ncbi:MAG: hypothetical protein AAF640_08795 [Pseudomonadota bacterium]